VTVTSRTRRDVLVAGVAVLVSLAGCSEGSDSATPTQTRDGTTTGGADGSTMTADLDLREANVVGVESDRQGRMVTFDVTLHHDDDGEDGYANWWQVETLDGEQRGRRVLTHPHSRQPFTRSDTFEIPTDISCVVVRGHDETHGYGGQAALVALDTGTVRFVDQGTESQSFSTEDCP